MNGDPPWEFDWDAANVRHLADHDITRREFEQAMLNDPVVVELNDEAGEDRWYALGATDRLRILFLVFTYRDERIRAITGWDANKRLRDLYFRHKAR